MIDQLAPTLFPRISPRPPGAGRLRVEPADFRVDELVGFEFSGTGDHLCLLIEKTGCTTHDVARMLAVDGGVRPVDIGWFGLKDKHAVTRQWFSVHLPGRLQGLSAEEHPDPSVLSTLLPATGKAEHLLPDGCRLLALNRHQRKLRTGTHAGNAFELIISAFTPEQRFSDHDTLQQALHGRLQELVSSGIPNYFGEQRFGIGNRNVDRACQWFLGQQRRRLSRTQRSMLFSAARAWLFNHVLAERIREGTWLEPLAEEPLMLAGSNSLFVNRGEPDLSDRLHRLDIHTTGPLWGKGNEADSCRIRERHWLRDVAPESALITDGLEQAGLTCQRRPLRVAVRDATIEVLPDRRLRLAFSLPAGSYATVLVRELVDYGAGQRP